jgi:glutamate/tyrosine decarboxylase-like PLP-dependent enzyme
MSEMDFITGYLEKSLKPYKKSVEGFRTLPEKGLPKEKILGILTKLASAENKGWEDGRVSGAVYHGEEELASFLEKVHSIYSQCNPLHVDIWPSAVKLDTEIVAMCSSMMHGDELVKGSVSSGGTESILLAMKAYRDLYKKKGITNPTVILPKSAHVAFSKACDYFEMEPVFIDLDDDFIVDVEKVKEAITPNTIALVGSAPCYPYGTYDPIEALSDIAKDKGIGLHVDGCLGGFITPWAKRAGYEVPEANFSTPGVTSISMDTHKYGFGPKGTSVILYRGSELFQHHLYVATNWQGGIYFTPTMAGSRPGFPIAAAWAVMLMMGDQGYFESAKKILDTGDYIMKQIRSMDGLKVLGRPLHVIAIASDRFDPYLILEGMSRKKWMLSGLMNPPAFHIHLTLRHTKEGVKEAFVRDLKLSAEEVAKGTIDSAPLAPIYGMSSALPKADVEMFMKNIVEWLYS